MEGIEKIMTWLIQDKAHYGYLLGHMKRVEDQNMPAMAASRVTDDGDLVLFYNPKLMEGITQQEASAVLEHECLHILNKHHFRGKDLTAMVSIDGRPVALNNIAGDIAINQFIGNLPKNTLSIERFIEQKMLKSGDENKSLEYYYSRLLRDLPKEQGCQGCRGGDQRGGGQGQDGKGGGKEGPEGQGGCGGHDTLEDAMKRCHDSHTHLRESGPGHEIAERKVEKIVNQTIKRLQETNLWGSMPGNLQRVFEQAAKSKTPWEAILRRFIRGQTKARPRRTLMRFNRRMGQPFAGKKYSQRGKVAVMVDTSGSIGDDILGLFSAEIDKMKDHVDIVVGEVDTELHHSYVFRGKMTKPHGGGGTDFNSFLSLFNGGRKASRKETIFAGCEAVILLTDGYCAPIKEVPRIPALLVLTPGGHTPEGVKWRNVIQIEERKS